MFVIGVIALDTAPFIVFHALVNVPPITLANGCMTLLTLLNPLMMLVNADLTAPIIIDANCFKTPISQLIPARTLALVL